MEPGFKLENIQVSNARTRNVRTVVVGKRQRTSSSVLTKTGDRARLLADTTDDLNEWLNQDYLTDLELAYWIPKFILMRCDKSFASLGTMSPEMRALAISQEKIRWRNFM